MSQFGSTNLFLNLFRTLQHERHNRVLHSLPIICMDLVRPIFRLHIITCPGLTCRLVHYAVPVTINLNEVYTESVAGSIKQKRKSLIDENIFKMQD